VLRVLKDLNHSLRLFIVLCKLPCDQSWEVVNLGSVSDVEYRGSTHEQRRHTELEYHRSSMI
jgi:hypothetical protein